MNLAGGRLLELLVVALTSMPAPSARADEPASYTPRPPAKLVLVGEDATYVSIKDVVTELLSRDGMAVTWAKQKHFHPQDIFDVLDDRVRSLPAFGADGPPRPTPRASPAPSPAAEPRGRFGEAERSERGGGGRWGAEERSGPSQGSHLGRNEWVSAWIDLSASAEARLYFRDAGAERFFIRSLPLARGIDEIAKEEIAHIVSNAVVALSQGGGETLTRSQARQALHMAPTPEQPEVGEKAPAPLRFAVAAMAGAQLFASDLPLVARGAFSLALTRGPRWNRAGGSFGGWLDLGYQPPGRYQGSAVGADVQAVSARAGMLYEIERSVLLRVGLGAGMDRIHYQPRGDSARVELASASSFYVPALSFWVGTDLRMLDWLALTSRISLDAALAQVHFDLNDGNGQTTKLLVPYVVLPTASIGLAVVF